VSVIRHWLAARHSLRVEVVLILGFYATYEATRGLVAGSRPEALNHGHAVARLERHLHVFVEPHVQHVAGDIPGLLGALGIAYLTLHLAVTSALLLWLHRRRPAAFPAIRTTLIVASSLSLIGFLAFPTAPPRMINAGLTDTVSNGAIDLNRGLVSALYNPYAAIPSMHVGYALVVGKALVRYGQSTLTRGAGILYPPFVLLVIVATGNHFFADAAAGGLVAAISFALTRAAQPHRSDGNVTPFPKPIEKHEPIARAA
jgi:hypothetical protein